VEKAIAKITAEYFKAVSHPIRIKIIKLLATNELCVQDIVSNLEIEQSNLSQHLSVLKKQGIVSSRSAGTRVIYWLNNQSPNKMISEVEEVLKSQIEQNQELLRRFG
jgi:ArsR family transcriptional regulator